MVEVEKAHRGGEERLNPSLRISAYFAVMFGALGVRYDYFRK